MRSNKKLWASIVLAVGFVALGILRATRPGLAGEDTSTEVPIDPSRGEIGSVDANTP